MLDTTWRNYGVAQSSGALPAGPMVIFVHMASVWVPFTSESKEAIADYDEIRKEIKLALQECGRRLGVFLRRRERAKGEFRRRNIFELYIEEVVEACNRLKGGKLAEEKLKEQLQKIAIKRTGGAKDRRGPGPRQRTGRPAPLDHRHRRGHRRRSTGAAEERPAVHAGSGTSSPTSTEIGGKPPPQEDADRKRQAKVEAPKATKRQRPSRQGRPDAAGLRQCRSEKSKDGKQAWREKKQKLTARSRRSSSVSPTP